MKIRFHTFSFSILRLKNLSLHLISSFMWRRALLLTDLVGMCSKLNLGSWILVVVGVSIFSLDSEKPSIWKHIGQSDNEVCSSSRSSCSQMFFKTVKPRKFIKEKLQHSCFSVKFAKSLRTPFLQNTSGGCFG